MIMVTVFTSITIFSGIAMAGFIGKVKRKSNIAQFPYFSNYLVYSRCCHARMCIDED